MRQKLREVLLKECHDGPLVGHGGAKCTTTFLKKSYYWPNLKDDAEEYVKICLTCQQNQTLNVATPLWPSVGVKLNTPKVGDLESSGTPECLEFDSKAQNYSY